MPYLYAIVRLLGGWRATAFACLATLAIGYAGVQTLRLDAAHKEAREAAVSALQARNDAVMAELSAIEAARAKEQERADSVNRIAAAYERGKADGKAAGDALRADVDAGRLVLRDKFKCARPRSSPAPPASGAPGGDGETGAYLSPADQDFLVRIAEEADATVRQLDACQAVIQDDRK